MNNRKTSDCQSIRSFRHFTLIELLVVIGIIALLMALLFPAIGAVRVAAMKVGAKTMANGLVVAIKQYRVTYGLMPGWDNSGGGGDQPACRQMGWN
jgi:prepilin-type N-terminal cleavage/methylation domain-containing protein